MEIIDQSFDFFFLIYELKCLTVTVTIFERVRNLFNSPYIYDIELLMLVYILLLIIVNKYILHSNTF